MPLIDTENLLQPVAGAEPTGANLEYDPAFAELERAALGRPEQQIGKAIAPGEPPDWKTVQEQAALLLGRSKDLRLVSYLLRALLHRHGFEGLAAGLAVARGLLERYWAPLHPQLDPDDQHDPTIRVSALGVLSDPAVLVALRSAPLFRSRAFGPVSFRDIAVATGEIPPTPSAPTLEMAKIEGAFQEADDATLESLSTALQSAADHLRAIEVLFSESAGVAGPDVANLAQLLKQVHQFVKQRLDRRRPEAGLDAGAGEGPQTNGVGSRSALSGQITSRDDVVRALDKICDYYARQEPSSPLPLLLQRCKRLATMSFIEIVREMVPDGLSQVELIAGKREE
jgi:type VI secretion system protein ImpA